MNHPAELKLHQFMTDAVPMVRQRSLMNNPLTLAS
jgi:hypothetical protein